MVITGREKVNRIREEGEMRILRRSNELRRELQNRFELRMKSVNERVEMNETNINTTHEKRIQQAAHRFVSDILDVILTPMIGMRKRFEA